MKMDQPCYLGVWLVLSLTLVVLHSMLSADAYNRHRRRVPPYSGEITAYSCEGSQMEINCAREDQIIQVKRATYGRYSLGICNPQRRNDFRTDCMTPRSLDVIIRRCSDRHGCTIPVLTRVFGGVDWCQSTPKYLQVTYKCVLVLPTSTIHSTTVSTTTTTTTTMTTPTPMPNTTLATVRRTKTYKTRPPPTPKQHEPSTLPSTRRPMTTRVTVNTETTTLSSTEMPTPPFDDEIKSCKARVMRNISWPFTFERETATEICPNGSTGVATWECGPGGKWIGQPKLKGCTSMWISDIQQKISQGASVTQVTSDLIKFVQTKPLYGGDMFKTAGAMEQILEATKDQTKNKSQEDRAEIVNSVTEGLVKLTSSLLSANKKESWKDLDQHDQSEMATQIVYCLEASGITIADSITTPGTVKKIYDNVALEVQVLDERVSEKKSITFSDTGLSNTTDSVSISTQVLKNNIKDGVVKVVYISYQNIGQWMSPSNKHLESKNDEEDEEKTVTTVNSKVFSLSINKLKMYHPLEKPLDFILEHKQKVNRSNPNCVFWNYNPKNMSEGVWSSTGCRLVMSNKTHTQCACDHLTNFAVLMDVSGTELSEHHEVSLQVITYFGCIISLVCLMLTWLTFTMFRNLHGDRTSIHKNLVFCLFAAEVIFLCGILETQNPVGCAVVAGLLHFFFLAAFAWMCLEGLQLYLMLVEVFEAEKSRLPYFYAIGYGIPVVIVGISASVDHHGYGTSRHCWLTADNYFVWSFVGPVCAVITINIAMLSIAVYMMCRHTPAVPSLKGSSKKKSDNIKSWIKGAAVLVVLLGLTWSFGILYISAETVAMAYIFTLFNSLQGVFIFVFHCLLNEKVQKEYKRWARHKKWLPNCVRIGYGGQKYEDTSLPTPSSSSNGPAHYFQKLFSGRKRRRSAGSSSGKSLATTKSPLQQDFYPSLSHQGTLPYNGEYTLSSKSHRAAPKSPTFVRNGSEVKHGHGHNSGINGDLSQVGASVVDSDGLTEYCQTMQSNDHLYETIDGKQKIQMPVEDYLEPLSHRSNADNCCKCDSSGSPRSYSCIEQEDIISGDEELFQITEVVQKHRNSNIRYTPEAKPLLEQDQQKPPIIPYSESEQNLVSRLENEAKSIRGVDLDLDPQSRSCDDIDFDQNSTDSLADGCHNHSAPNLNKSVDKSETKDTQESPMGEHRSSLPNLNDWVTFNSLERPGDSNLKRLYSDGSDKFDPHRYNLNSSEC